MQMGGRMPAEDDARLAQRLQEEFDSSSGARPKRSAASEAKKRLAEARIAPQPGALFTVFDVCLTCHGRKIALACLTNATCLLII